MGRQGNRYIVEAFRVVVVHMDMQRKRDRGGKRRAEEQNDGENGKNDPDWFFHAFVPGVLV